eukprot:PhM_4_TR13286/c0_g1_i1/m.36370
MNPSISLQNMKPNNKSYNNNNNNTKLTLSPNIFPMFASLLSHYFSTSYFSTCYFPLSSQRSSQQQRRGQRPLQALLVVLLLSLIVSPAPAHAETAELVVMQGFVRENGGDVREVNVVRPNAILNFSRGGNYSSSIFNITSSVKSRRTQTLFLMIMFALGGGDTTMQDWAMTTRMPCVLESVRRRFPFASGALLCPACEVLGQNADDSETALKLNVLTSVVLHVIALITYSLTSWCLPIMKSLLAGNFRVHSLVIRASVTAFVRNPRSPLAMFLFALQIGPNIAALIYLLAREWSSLRYVPATWWHSSRAWPMLPQVQWDEESSHINRYLLPLYTAFRSRDAFVLGLALQLLDVVRAVLFGVDSMNACGGVLFALFVLHLFGAVFVAAYRPYQIPLQSFGSFLGHLSLAGVVHAVMTRSERLFTLAAVFSLVVSFTNLFMPFFSWIVQKLLRCLALVEVPTMASIDFDFLKKAHIRNTYGLSLVKSDLECVSIMVPSSQNNSPLRTPTQTTTTIMVFDGNEFRKVKKAV